MEVFLIRLLQFMLAISILVLLHEGGHFFFSKLFHVRVEKFFLFFDPWFHIFQFKPKNSDTTYGMGWLPLGGYCKISGMIDESFDKEQMKQEPQPYEFRSKPAWQRFFIMVGGVLVNFLLALFIYSMILFYWGDTYIPVKNMSMGMKFNDTAKSMGFQDGDILIKTDKKVFKDFGIDLYRNISESKTVTVIRKGKTIDIALPDEMNLLSMIKEQPSFVAPFIPAKVDSVMPKSPAEKVGIKAGAIVNAINGKTIDCNTTFLYELGRLSDMMASAKNQKDSMKIRTVNLVYTNAGSKDKDTTSIVLTKELKLNVYFETYASYYKPITVNYGLLQSIPAGTKYGMSVLKGYVGDMKYVFSKEGVKSLGGFGAIGSLFPPVWDWFLFWKMTAFLSIILAFMNILPIPALDGGHILFLLYEMITKRKPSDNFMIKAEYVGFIILIALLVVANLNDVLRWLGFM